MAHFIQLSVFIGRPQFIWQTLLQEGERRQEAVCFLHKATIIPVSVTSIVNVVVYEVICQVYSFQVSSSPLFTLVEWICCCFLLTMSIHSLQFQLLQPMKKKVETPLCYDILPCKTLTYKFTYKQLPNFKIEWLISVITLFVLLKDLQAIISFQCVLPCINKCLVFPPRLLIMKAGQMCFL